MLETLTPEERARFEQLDPAQQAYVERCEPLWRRAHEIARKNPGVDASDVFHVLYTWNDTPSQRLKRSLERFRPRPHRG